MSYTLGSPIALGTQRPQPMAVGPRRGQLTRGFTSSFPVTVNMVERPNGVHTAGESRGVKLTTFPRGTSRPPLPWVGAAHIPALTQQEQHSEERDAGVEVGQVALPEVCGRQGGGGGQDAAGLCAPLPTHSAQCCPDAHPPPPPSPAPTIEGLPAHSVVTSDGRGHPDHAQHQQCQQQQHHRRLIHAGHDALQDEDQHRAGEVGGMGGAQGGGQHPWGCIPSWILQTPLTP